MHKPRAAPWMSTLPAKSITSFLQYVDHKIDFFQISLDGNPDDHNASRKLASGEETFDRIWSNLIAMKGTRADFVVLLRLHYTMQNFMTAPEFAKPGIADGEFGGGSGRSGIHSDLSS